MPRAPSEREPLVSPNPADTLPPLPPSETPRRDEACETSRDTFTRLVRENRNLAGKNPTKILRYAAFDAPCYGSVSLSVLPSVFSLKTIAQIRVFLAGLMVFLICQLCYLDYKQGKYPVCLMFFELGVISWILMTARACLTAYWSTRVLQLSEEGAHYETHDINLFFGIKGSTVESFYWMLHENTQALAFFTSFVYWSLPEMKDSPQLVDYFRGIIYSAPFYLAIFEDLFLNCLFVNMVWLDLRRVISFVLVLFYINVVVPFGFYLVDGEFKLGFIDGRFFGGDRDLELDLTSPVWQIIVILGLNLCDLMPGFVDSLKFCIAMNPNLHRHGAMGPDALD